MPDLDMRPERREAVAAQLMSVLDGAVVGSSARLRGSLAAGTAGPFSDIDLLWVVPDSAFPAAVRRAGEGPRTCTTGAAPA